MIVLWGKLIYLHMVCNIVYIIFTGKKIIIPEFMKGVVFWRRTFMSVCLFKWLVQKYFTLLSLWSLKDNWTMNQSKITWKGYHHCYVMATCPFFSTTRVCKAYHVHVLYTCFSCTISTYMSGWVATLFNFQKAKHTHGFYMILFDYQNL